MYVSLSNALDKLHGDKNSIKKVKNTFEAVDLYPEEIKDTASFDHAGQTSECGETVFCPKTSKKRPQIQSKRRHHCGHPHPLGSKIASDLIIRM